VAELLGNELPLEVSSRQSELARLRERQQKFQDWGGIAGLITFGLILILFIILVFTQMIMKGGALIPVGLLLILLAIGAGIMGLFQGYSKSLKEKLANPPLPKPAKSGEARELDAFREPVNSITDRTTELLSPVKSTDTGKMND